MLIFSTTITNRLQYILQVVFNQLLGIEFQLTDSNETFINSDLPKLNYSKQKLGIENEIFIQSVDLLFESDIHKQEISTENPKNWNKLIMFFETDSNSDVPFDIFAASFYLIIRYEEYLPFKPDKFGRFPSSESLAAKMDFLEQPLVNLWSMKLLIVLKNKYPQLKFKQPEYKYLPTFDIDNAYAVLHKGFFRTLAILAKSVFGRNLSDLFDKISIPLKRKPDTYDSYEYLFYTFKRYDLKPIFFFIVGKYGKFDKNPSIKNQSFRKLIQSIANQYDVGIHPSFNSNSKFEILKSEFKNLKSVTNQSITKSRQHYLKLSFPETYRNLLKLNAKADYTMGYADTIGFRASICVSYPFFDLQKNEVTDLQIVPFQIMDETLKEYLKLSPAEADLRIKNIVETIKNCGGLFVSLWHNESLGNSPRWTGWKLVFENLISVAQPFRL